jgi:Zn-dependent protease
VPFPLPDPPFIIAVLIALTVHEYAHGLVAYWLGDPTAKHEGRLTLNPVAHLDPLGTLMFLLIRFGWGKPVPVNPRYFKHYRRDTALVAVAGPVSNLLIAVGAYIVLFALASRLPQVGDILFGAVEGNPALRLVIETLRTSVIINLGLMAFNLLPIAPLDGSKILGAFVPLKYEDQYEQYLQYGTYVLLSLLILERLFNVPILLGWIYGIINPILHLLSLIGGGF